MRAPSLPSPTERRAVLAGLGAAGLLVVRRTAVAAGPEQVCLAGSSRLTGTERSTAARRGSRQLDVGQRVGLRHVADDGYDARRVEVLTAEGELLGALPRGTNDVVAGLLAAGIEPYGVVIHAETGPPRPEIWITVLLERAKV